jgi:nucleoside-diphosphate-sugar epimerase
MWVGSPTIPLTFVLTEDVADYLADAAYVPGVEGQRIDIGWDRPVSIQEVAQVAGRLLGRQIRVRSMPAGIMNAISTVIGKVSPMVNDLGAMLRWFETGRYIADPTRQRDAFGEVPTAEEAIARLLHRQGHAISG